MIGPGSLIGFDMGLKFRPHLAVVPDPDNAFFYNRTDTEYPVIVTGGSYGDGKVDARVWDLLLARLLGHAPARNFPVCE